jgi:glutamyl-Q tRNA(Asp) synthetase
MKAATARGGPLSWTEAGISNATESIPADPAAWGDVVLARKDTPTSYHLAVVVDDALQGITHVVRGRDLLHATSVHRLLQTLLGLPEPIYHHHRLALDGDGRKLSKSTDGHGAARAAPVRCNPSRHPANGWAHIEHVHWTRRTALPGPRQVA